MTQSIQANEVLDTLGKRLKHVRTRKGLKLGALASQLGISRTSLNQWESGAVKNPDTIKLGQFSRICEVNLDWLIKGDDDEVELELASSARRAISKRREPVRDGNGDDVLKVGAVLPEVTAHLTAHAKGWDMTPRGHWSIPEQILELGFNADASSCIIKRVLTRDGSELGIDRGDYVLIDTSRNLIDEPGVYILADPCGLSARRALATKDANKLHVTLIDDDGQSSPRDSGDHPPVLGRVMGILKPA